MERPKLLLADDSVTIRKVVELTFADEGIDVTAVADADSAMQRFVENQPDIFLVDASLTGTSGYRICEMIKEDEATAHIPVLLLVGSFERFNDDEALRVGADGFMTKPFQSIRELVAKVRSLLAAPKHATDDEGPIPIFGEGFPESTPNPDAVGSASFSLAPQEDDDIEDLYRESFAPAAPQPQAPQFWEPEPSASEPQAFEVFTGETEGLGYVGMDDDMIEASYATTPDRVDDIDFPVIPQSSEYDPDKKFDWSPDALIRDLSSTDDHALESQEHRANDIAEPASEATEENVAGRISSDEISRMDTLEIDRKTFDRVKTTDLDADEDVEILDLDLDPYQSFSKPISHQAELAAEPAGEIVSNADGPEEDDEPDPSIHETVPYSMGEQPPVHGEESEDAAPQPTGEEYPPELIDRIARQVVERLSDTVVREIARIEVPRVAEKLIREALNQGK